MNLRIKPHKRLPRQVPDKLAELKAINHGVSTDFMRNQLSFGRGFRLLNVINDYSREGLEIEVVPSLPSAQVIRS
nr:hypothetical protein [Salinisphaera japonica]